MNVYERGQVYMPPPVDDAPTSLDDTTSTVITAFVVVIWSGFFLALAVMIA